MSKRFDILLFVTACFLAATLTVSFAQPSASFSQTLDVKTVDEDHSVSIEKSLADLNNTAEQAQALLTQLEQTEQLKTEQLDANLSEIDKLIAAQNSYQQLFMASDFDSCFEDYNPVIQ